MRLMPARASGRWPYLTSPSTAAPRRWPCARAGGPTRSWAGCTPTMPRVPTPSFPAAPAAAVPFLPAPQSRTRRDDPRRPAHGRDAAPDRGRSSAALDTAPPCRMGPRALRAGVLSRDDPNGPARPQAVLEEGQVRLWPYRRANGEHTIDVLRRLRAEVPAGKLIVLWDGAPYRRAKIVREVACELEIDLVRLPGYSPDLMPVEALWRWLREDVTYHHCHASAEDLTRRVGAFEARLNRDPVAIADRLWVKNRLDPHEEKLRFSNLTRFRQSRARAGRS